jgi:hypothetical protein
LDAFVDEAVGLVIATVDHGAHEAGGAPARPEAALDNNADPRLLLVTSDEMRSVSQVLRRIWRVVAWLWGVNAATD